MMRKLLYISALVFLAVLTGCADRERVSARLDALDSLLSLPPTDPEPPVNYGLILTQLDTLLPDVVGDDALEAHWNLLCATAEDKAERPLVSDLRIRPAYDYYRDATQDGTRGDSTLLHRFAQSCFYLGVHYYHLDSTARMERLMQKSAEVAKSCNDHYTAYLALAYLSRQIKLDNSKEAVQMAEEALHEYGLTHHPSVYNQICLLLNAGSVWLHAPDKEGARDYYEEALDCSLATPDSVLYGFILSSIASYYDWTGDTETAVAYMNRALSHLPDNDNSWNLTFSHVYLHHDALDEAEERLNRSEPHTPLEKFHWFKYMQVVKIRKHDVEGSLQLNDSLSYYSNRMYLDALAQKNNYFQENLRKEKSLFLQQQHAERMKTVYVMMIGIIVVIVILVLLQVRYRHRIQMLETAHLMRKAEQEAQHQKLINQKNLQRIALLKNQLEKQSDVMERFKAADDLGSDLMHMTDEDWQSLEIALNDTYLQFVTRLRRQFPDMSEDGLRLCMLEKIGLTTHQMSNIFSISPPSVTKRKQRLKKDYLSMIDAGKSFDEIIGNM